MRQIRVGWMFSVLLALAIGSSAVSAQTCTTQACAFVAGVPYLIPAGSTMAALDGAIGPEWSEAFDKPTAVWVDGRRLPIDLYLVHDEGALYLAIHVEPKERYKDTLRVSISFENVNGNPYGPGTNLILVVEDRGQGVPTAVDYHYEDYNTRVLDTAQDAQGFGRWDPYERAYEFEVRVALSSGDPQDFSAQAGVPFILVVGLETVARDGAVTSKLETPDLLFTI